ncbi:sensor histidine kinase [Romboutsia weinsteinii]|uniref:histidine kinase n=1 Tax=Romboutsia weinsteinii TaxID=2020949 RepID=A0A371J601_9FIRM|nr:ATP-binding protein [Romboutsia weinsteinii]RDY28192.1 sensor histidine kinase [Romboutsia weinsteinii]
MFNKLRYRLSFIFILFSLSIIFLVNIVNHHYIEKKFNIYTSDRIQQSKLEIKNKIAKTYNDNSWDEKSIEDIGSDAISSGLLITIKDKDKHTIWNARDYNNIKCEKVLSKIRENVNKINPNSDIVNTFERFNLKQGQTEIGELDIEYIGPIYYEDSDVVFFEMLDRVLFILAVLFFIISIIVGGVLSYAIGRPILKVIDATNYISEGNYSKRINEDHSIYEINKLVKSVNMMARDLNKQEKIRQELTNDISHELRTPLTTVQAQLEAIMDGLWEPSQERLKSIYDELQRLNRLIVSTENLSRYDSNKLELNKSNVNLKSAITTILTNFEKQLSDKSINLQVDLKDININVDKDKISQVIINIISNAIKYTPNKGEIFVKCFNKNDNVYILIKDSGIGINKEDIDYIFERFYRTDKSRARETGGIGIGLTISREIVKAHKGSINVYSKVNEGSNFIIKLPIK